MSEPRPTEDQDPTRRLEWWRIVLLVVLGVVLAACLAFAVFLGLFMTHYGDPAPPKEMPIVNATRDTLTVYSVGEFHIAGKKTEVALMELPPGEANFTSGPCDNSEMVARDPKGNEVARHEPSHVCDPSIWIPWIISDGVPGDR